MFVLVMCRKEGANLYAGEQMYENQKWGISFPSYQERWNFENFILTALEKDQYMFLKDLYSALVCKNF